MRFIGIITLLMFGLQLVSGCKRDNGISNGGTSSRAKSPKSQVSDVSSDDGAEPSDGEEPVDDDGLPPRPKDDVIDDDLTGGTTGGGAVKQGKYCTEVAEVSMTEYLIPNWCSTTVTNQAAWDPIDNPITLNSSLAIYAYPAESSTPIVLKNAESGTSTFSAKQMAAGTSVKVCLDKIPAGAYDFIVCNDKATNCALATTDVNHRKYYYGEQSASGWNPFLALPPYAPGGKMPIGVGMRRTIERGGFNEDATLWITKGGVLCNR